jgi:hypothetical protein
VLPFERDAPDDTAAHRRDGASAVRLGLAEVASLGRRSAERIVAERRANGPFTDMSDLARRVGLTTAQLEALAAADAFESLGVDRRGGMWSAAQAAAERPDQLPDTQVVVQPPLFGQMTSGDVLIADMWSTGMSTDDHPVGHLRERLSARGVLSVEDTRTAETGRRVEVGGIVTHRQRPATASGITFLNVEDESGLVNVICSVGVWGRYRRVARESPAVIVRGILERSPRRGPHRAPPARGPDTVAGLPVTAAPARQAPAVGGAHRPRLPPGSARCAHRRCVLHLGHPHGHLEPTGRQVAEGRRASRPFRDRPDDRESQAGSAGHRHPAGGRVGVTA